MEAIELLKTRRSCRSYLDKQIEESKLNTILECALNAPSGMNKQSTKIVVVRNKTLRNKLSKLNGAVMDSTNDPFYGAPVVCVILAPNEPGLNWVKDGSLVIGSMQYAAYDLGIGSCWINRAKEMLELPEGKEILKEWDLEGYVGVGCCILGYPDKALPPKVIKEDRIKRID